MSLKIIVIGAGLSGLSCARKLQREGHEVKVLEASDGVGGRVRTDNVDDFRLDRGFQVYFDAYPFASHEVNVSKLNPRRPIDGALLHYSPSDQRLFGRQYAFSNATTFGDKFALLSWLFYVQSKQASSLLAGHDETIGEQIKRFGLSDRIVEGFFKPFFSGVFLDDKLETSARVVNFVWKMLADSGSMIPALGMGKIADQIADDLLPGTVEFGAAVKKITQNPTGVETEDGTFHAADYVILATEGPAADRILGRPATSTPLSSTCAYYEVDEMPIKEPILMLNASRKGLINEIMPNSLVSPELTPGNRHMIGVTSLGIPGLSDTELDKTYRAEMAQWFPKARTDNWRLIKLYRIPQASYSQKPGFMRQTPPHKTELDNVYQAGDATTFCSIEGAFRASARVCHMIVESAR